MSSNVRPATMERITTPALAESFIDQQLAELRQQIGDKKVLLALSGGVDSSVVAALLIKAIGKQLICVHVNHGLLRKGEPEQVIEVFQNQMDANLIYVDAVDRFLDKLAGISDPEQKRKIIGKEFIDVFAEEAQKLEGISFLAQGTIYPDILESDGIKSHHNVGGLPEDLQFELVEPVKLLYKDEVRVVGKALGLPKAPRRIEGYDISNTQGVLSVASMVVFIDGEPAKKEYRRFRIKTVEGANDFASLNEVLGRRFAHGLQEKAEREEQGLSPIGGKFSDLPDLVLIDGGPQQLRFARQALLDMGADVAMFGLAKKQEEIFLPDREDPICLDHHTPELHLIQRVRDEAHRFCITHHRGLRGKASIHSQLEDIPGIGPKRRKALLTKLGSMKAIREATEEELLKVPGMNQAAAKAVRKWAEAQEKK